MFLNKGINVLSLFDGMSCGRIALARSGIAVNTYNSSEVDKYAMTVSKDNWDNNHMGDVTKWREWDIDWSSIDLILAGSPCQGFSFAGKQLAFDDPRSALFFVFVDILNHINSERMGSNKTPVKFMLENVKMKKEYLEVINNHVGVEPVFINSALVSAQSRQRYYWFNWDVEQPKDKGVILRDVLETNPDNITMMSDKFTARNAHILRDNFDGKAKCLSAMEYVKNGRQGDYIKCGSIVGRRVDKVTGKRDDNNKDIKIEQRLEIRGDEKTGCLTTVGKDKVVVSVDEKYYYTEEQLSKMQLSGTNQNKDIKIIAHRKGYRRNCQIFDENGKTEAMDTGQGGGRVIGVAETKPAVRYRKLTPIECERLQTVPDNYTQSVSNTQRYKMLGNGWTVDVIKHILDNSGLHK